MCNIQIHIIKLSVRIIKEFELKVIITNLNTLLYINVNVSMANLIYIILNYFIIFSRDH